MKTIQKFKELFPDNVLDIANDSVIAYDKEGNHLVTLFHAKKLIEECFVGERVLTHTFDPQDAQWVNLGASEYILTNFGNYETAYKSL